jgi:hypothetical protein
MNDSYQVAALAFGEPDGGIALEALIWNNPSIPVV